MSRLPAVIWDMGGIIYRYFTELMLDVGAEQGWPIDRIPLGPTGAVPDADYERLQQGEIDEIEYVRLIVERLAAEGIDFYPMGRLDYTGQARPETGEVIRRIYEAGHPQALLTNDATRWLGESWWETWEFAEWFETMIDVVMVGIRKPSPEPYLAAARALDLPPADCIFIDDLEVNCRGAEAIGMMSHLFDVTDVQSCLDSLVKRLGLNDR